VFNEAIGGLGLTEATCTAWGAGYAPKGIMRGRFAIPIHDRAATLLAYVGVAITEETSPRLYFPNGFDPHSVTFGADRVKEGELYLVRDPLDPTLCRQRSAPSRIAITRLRWSPIRTPVIAKLAARTLSRALLSSPASSEGVPMDATAQSARAQRIRELNDAFRLTFAGDPAVHRVLEFFAATIRNKNTRMADWGGPASRP
jgi:hypothetical protein